MWRENNKPSGFQAAVYHAAVRSHPHKHKASYDSADGRTHLSSQSNAKSSDGFSMRCSAKEQMTISTTFASAAPVLMLLFDEACPRSELSGEDASDGLLLFGAPTGLDAISGIWPSAMSRKESGCA